jgi:hypothetical protein
VCVCVCGCARGRSVKARGTLRRGGPCESPTSNVNRTWLSICSLSRNTHRDSARMWYRADHPCGVRSAERAVARDVWGPQGTSHTRGRWEGKGGMAHLICENESSVRAANLTGRSHSRRRRFNRCCRWVVVAVVGGGGWRQNGVTHRVTQLTKHAHKVGERGAVRENGRGGRGCWCVNVLCVSISWRGTSTALACSVC